MRTLFRAELRLGNAFKVLLAWLFTTFLVSLIVSVPRLTTLALLVVFVAMAHAVHPREIVPDRRLSQRVSGGSSRRNTVSRHEENASIPPDTAVILPAVQ